MASWWRQYVESIATPEEIAAVPGSWKRKAAVLLGVNVDGTGPWNRKIAEDLLATFGAEGKFRTGGWTRRSIPEFVTDLSTGPWARTFALEAGVPGWLRAINAAALGGYDAVNDRSYAIAKSLVRASTGTMDDGAGGRISFGTNVLRRIDGIGMLIEREATQSIRATDDVGGDGWTTPPSQFTRTGNADDGFTFTVNADFSGFLVVEQSFTSIPATSNAYLSFDLHASGLGLARGWTPLTGYSVSFNALTGVATGTQASMVSIGGGWYRCRWWLSNIGSDLSAIRIGLGGGASSINYTTGQFFRIRAPQVEIDRFSSYIPNTATNASASRAADALTLSAFAGTKLQAVFDDLSSQDLSPISAPHLIDPVALNRPLIRSIVSLAA